MLTYTSSWRKQHEALNMLHPSNPSNDIGMVIEHGMHLPATGKDKWEAEIKKQEQLLHTCVWKGQSNFLREHFISQHCNAYVSMSAWQNTFNTSCPMNTLELAFYLMQFNVPMQDYRPQWLVSKRIMVHMVCGTTLRGLSHIYYHTTQ